MDLLIEETSCGGSTAAMDLESAVMSKQSNEYTNSTKERTNENLLS